MCPFLNLFTCNVAELELHSIRHFHITHKTLCLPSKLWSNALWNMQSPEEKLKTTAWAKFERQTKCIVGDVTEVANSRKIASTHFRDGHIAALMHHVSGPKDAVLSCR